MFEFLEKAIRFWTQIKEMR